MRKRLFWWEAGTAVFVFAAGSFLHFLYGWSGENLVAAAFSAVNESVWEHMKLLFVPLFLEFFLHAAVLGKVYPNLPAARAAGTLAGLLLIPAGFYTYTGIFGTHTLWADIGLFLAAAVLSCMVEFLILQKGCCRALWQQATGLIVLWGLAFFFVWCTFRPPEINLWRDAETGGFGMEK